MQFPWKVNWDWKHTAILVGTAFGAAAVAALQQQKFPASWHDAATDLAAAGFAGVTAIIALARKSFLSQTQGGGQ